MLAEGSTCEREISTKYGEIPILTWSLGMAEKGIPYIPPIYPIHIKGPYIRTLLGRVGAIPRAHETTRKEMLVHTPHARWTLNPQTHNTKYFFRV